MRKILPAIVSLMCLMLASTAQTQDRNLDAWYRGYNHKYFQDELPFDTEITRTLNDDRFMAITFYDNGRYHIEMNPKYNLSTKTERINLLHESCHIRIFIEHDEEFDDHGPHWQSCMHGLSAQGAFEDIW